MYVTNGHRAGWVLKDCFTVVRNSACFVKATDSQNKKNMKKWAYFIICQKHETCAIHLNN